MSNFLRICLVLLFRLTVWCLLTGSLSTTNISLGIVVCVLIPFGDFRRLKLNALIPEILLTLRLPFDMLKESVQLMLIADPTDNFVEEAVSDGARSGSQYAEFLDLFRITFTPMSLVTRKESSDFWRVHLVGSSKSTDLQSGGSKL